MCVCTSFNSVGRLRRITALRASRVAALSSHIGFRPVELCIEYCIVVPLCMWTMYGIYESSSHARTGPCLGEECVHRHYPGPDVGDVYNGEEELGLMTRLPCTSEHGVVLLLVHNMSTCQKTTCTDMSNDNGLLTPKERLQCRLRIWQPCSASLLHGE
jgi:hypothetical protein